MNEDIKKHNYGFIWNDRQIYLPNKLKTDLDVIISDMKNSEMDAVIVIDGAEGTGKSRSGRIIGAYLSQELGMPFNTNNIHFNTKDYIEFSESKSRWTINDLDESREALNKKRFMSKGNVSFLNWLSENRDKQQAHIIILPAVHDLESYIVAWRMLILIHHLKVHKKIKTSYVLDRGFFRIYTPSSELQYHINNRSKFGAYSYPKNYKYWGKFMDCEPFDDIELNKYKQKKAEKRAEKYTEDGVGDNDEKIKLAKLFHFAKLNGLSYRAIEAQTGFNADYISTLVRRQGYEKPKKTTDPKPHILNIKGGESDATD